MQCVILAAGLGTRMGELTRDRQKVLLPLGRGKTSIIETILDNLPDEIDEVFIVVGYKAEQVQEKLEKAYGSKKISYIRQPELKGTGHALSLLKGKIVGKFLVLMGDDLYKKEDLEKLIQYPLAILVWEVQRHDANDFQARLQMDEQGKLVDIIERLPVKKGMLVNTGAYIMDERYFDLPLRLAGNKTDEFGLPQTFLQLAQRGDEIKLVKASDWQKISTPEDLKV